MQWEKEEIHIDNGKISKEINTKGKLKRHKNFKHKKRRGNTHTNHFKKEKKEVLLMEVKKHSIRRVVS